MAVLAGVACAVTVGCIYKERLNFAWQYSRLEKAADDSALKAAAQKTADASADVVDVLILNKQNKVTYSAKNSEFGAGTLELTRLGSNQKYLTAKNYPAAVFQFVKSEEFMLNSIMNKDFGKIRTDYDDDSAFETNLAEKNIYMLSRVGIRGGSKAYVITVPTTVPGGLTALKGTAALAMLFFLRVLGAAGTLAVQGRRCLQAAAALLGADWAVYQPNWFYCLQNLQAQLNRLPRLRRRPKRRPPVLQPLRQAAGRAVRALRLQGRAQSKLLPPLRKQN